MSEKNFSQFPARTLQRGDHLVGYRTAASGGEGRFDASTIFEHTLAHTNPRALAEMLHFDGATIGAVARQPLGAAGAIGTGAVTGEVRVLVPTTTSTDNRGIMGISSNSTRVNVDRSLALYEASGRLCLTFFTTGPSQLIYMTGTEWRARHAGKWVWIHWVRDPVAETLRIWTDGIEESLTTSTTIDGSEVTLDLASTYLLAGVRGTGQYWSGEMGVPRIYNYAKTAAEIADLVRQGPTFADFAGGSMVEQSSGLLTIGRRYRITAQSTSDFTSAGAADSNVGTEFVAITTGSGLLDADNKVIPLGLITNPQITRTAQIRDAGPNKLHGFITSGVTPLGGHLLPTTWTQSVTGYPFGSDNPLIFDPHFIYELWVKPTTSTIPNVTLKRGGASGTEVVAAESAGTQNVWKKLTVIASAAEGAVRDKYHVTFSTSAACDFRLIAQPL